MEFKKEGVTSPGDVVQLKNVGMPRRGSGGKTFGHLYIRISVVFPKVLIRARIGGGVGGEGALFLSKICNARIEG